MTKRFAAHSDAERRWWLILIASLCALMLVAAGCGSDDDDSTASGPSSASGSEEPELTEITPVKVGVTALGVNVFWDLQVADGTGIFEKNNLKVEFVSIATPGNLVSAAAGGSTDFVGVATDTLVNAIDSGAPLTIVSAGAFASFDLVAKSELGSFDQLKGKKIGIADPAAGSTVLVLELLKQNGISKDDVRLVPAGGTPERLAALESGVVDATMLADPATYVATEKGDFTSLGKTSEAVYPYLSTAYAVNADWATKNRAAVVAFLKSIEEAKTWLYDPANKQAAIDVFVKYGEIDRALAEKSYQAMFVDDKTMAPTLAIEQPAMQSVFDIMNETADTDKDRTMDDYIGTEYLDAAAGG